MNWIDRTIAVVLILTCFIVLGYLPQDNKIPDITTSSQIDINVVFNGKPIKPFTAQQQKCLADNIYYEASNQPYEGKLGVAFVTMNRLADVHYPNSICSVVYQRLVPNVCQFSWTCEERTHFNETSWREARHIAQIVIEHITLGLHELSDPTYGALFFHTTWVAPSWRKVFYRTVQIGDHIFYRPNLVVSYMPKELTTKQLCLTDKPNFYPLHRAVNVVDLNVISIAIHV